MKKQTVLTLVLLGMFCSAQAANSSETGTEEGSKAATSAPEKPTPVSSNDNFIGDCFKVFITTKDTLGNDISAGWYLTLSQAKDTDALDLVKVKSAGYICSVDDPDPDTKKPTRVTATASELMKLGAQRTGWVYGALILPYKYHFDDKSFSSEASIGPYLGRRSTLGNISYIWTLTAGLTPLSVDSVDQNGNKKSTSLLAFTSAIGLMFELNKGASPFRAGIFYGRDMVSSNSAVTYTHDRKTWLAVQLGWDFVAK